MLVLRLQTPHDPEPAWARLEGQHPSTWTHGSWENLLPLLRGQQVVLLIPARDVLLTQTTLNTRNQRQLQQAIPYALEDALADDPEQQHIVWHTRPDTTQVDVAVIDRECLRGWLAAMQAHQIRPTAILPDVFALPWDNGSITLWQQGEQVWLRTGELSGYATTPAALPLLLDNLTATTNPLRVRLYAEQPPVWSADPRLDIVPETQAEQLYATSLQPAMKLNLLQGWQDEANTLLRQQWQRWQLPAGLAATAATLALVWFGVNLYRMQQQLTTTDNENLALFAELFPEAGSVKPRSLNSRLESELLNVQSNNQPTSATASPLPSLARFATALNTAAGLQVEEIRFQGNTLSIDLIAPEQQQIETLRTALEQQPGKPAELLSSRTADSVKATLTLGGAS